MAIKPLADYKLRAGDRVFVDSETTIIVTNFFVEGKADGSYILRVQGNLIEDPEGGAITEVQLAFTQAEVIAISGAFNTTVLSMLSSVEGRLKARLTAANPGLTFAV